MSPYTHSLLMLLDNPFVNDPRVQKHIDALNECAIHVHLVAVKQNDLPDYETHEGYTLHRILDVHVLTTPYKSRQDSIIEELMALVEKHQLSCVFANDHFCLHIAAKLKKRQPFLHLHYDAHEYLAGWLHYQTSEGFFLRLKGQLVHRIFTFLEKKNLADVDSFSTVSEGLAELFKRSLNAVPVVVVRNVPYLAAIHPGEAGDFQQLLRRTPKEFILVHSGLFYYNNETISWLFECVEQLSTQLPFALLLVVNESTKKRIVQHDSYAQCKDAIIFHDYVPYTSLLNLLHTADAGLVLNYKPTWLSHWHSLPNRIFDYCNAELPILSTKQPEFKRIIDHYGNGHYFDVFDNKSFENGIKAIQANAAQLKANSIAAKQELNWNLEKHKLQAIFTAIFPSS